MSMQGGRMGGQESMKMPNIDPSQMTMYLKNMEFPADKQKIISMAKDKGMPENVVQWLNKLPNKQYSSSTDVENEFKKMM